MLNYDHVPSRPPTWDEWEARRRTFDQLWLDAMYARSTTTSEHVSSLKFELERCFCSGAWIACIILSAAVIEIHLSNLGGWKSPGAHRMLETLNIVPEWEALKDRRNKLIHGSVDDDLRSRLPSEEYINQRYALELEAEVSVGLALRVALSDLSFD